MNAGFFGNWTRQVRKGLLELAILSDIARHRMYGYEIEKRFCKSQGLLLSEGTIYMILRRFREQGFVKTRQARSADGPKRRYYELTTAGQQMLAQMNTYWHAIARQMDSLGKGRQSDRSTARSSHPVPPHQRR
jgi:PadR family transcriptional regulator PadR